MAWPTGNAAIGKNKDDTFLSDYRSGILMHTGEWEHWNPSEPMPNRLGHNYFMKTFDFQDLKINSLSGLPNIFYLRGYENLMKDQLIHNVYISSKLRERGKSREHKPCKFQRHLNHPFFILPMISPLDGLFGLRKTLSSSISNLIAFFMYFSTSTVVDAYTCTQQTWKTLTISLYTSWVWLYTKILLKRIHTPIYLKAFYL